MIKSGFLEKAKFLTDAEKLELAHALMGMVSGEHHPAPRGTPTLLRERLAEAEANPDDYLTSENFWRGIREDFNL